jgi:predicted nuclease of predicted toxin-antitoxin system
MRFFADESVDQQIVAELRRRGHEVIYVAELEPGMDDESVLDRSLQVSGVLITADKDFGEMVFRQQRVAAGVLLVRLAGVKPKLKASWVAEIVDRYGAGLHGAFAVLAPGRLRLRRRIM